MNGHINRQDDQGTVVYVRGHDNGARVLAYLSPVLFWGTVGALAGGIFLLG